MPPIRREKVFALLRILQRYVLREVLVPTVLALVTLTFVLLIQMLFRQANEMTGILSLSLVFRMIGYALPSLLILTVPMAILTGVLLGVGRLTVDSEIKAFRTHGINLFPVFAPVLIFGVVAAALSLFNSLSFAPELFKKIFDEFDRLKQDLIYSLEPGRFYDDFRSQGAPVVLYFDGKDPVTGELKDGYIAVEGSPRAFQSLQTKEDETTKFFFLAASGRIVARDSIISPVFGKEGAPAETDETNRPPAAEMILSSGTIHFLGKHEGTSSSYTLLGFKEMTVSLDAEVNLLDKKSLAPTLTLAEFQETIEELDAAHYRKQQKTSDGAGEEKGRLYSEKAQFFRAELFQRISISLACFSFVLIGLPLSIFIRPSGKSVGITIAFLLIMAYYGVMHYGVVLTRQGAGIGPEVGPYVIFLPNVVLILLGAVLLHRTVHR